MNFQQFRHAILRLDGVTYVGAEHHPSVGVETDEDARKLRQMIDLNIPMFVTGPIYRVISETIKNEGMSGSLENSTT